MEKKFVKHEVFKPESGRVTKEESGKSTKEHDVAERLR